MQALGFSDGPMIFGSSALGGLGSKLAGGVFFQGFATGLAVGAFNHAIEHVTNIGGGDPPSRIDEIGVKLEAIKERMSNYGNQLVTMEVGAGMSAYRLGDDIKRQFPILFRGESLKQGHYNRIKLNLFGNVNLTGRSVLGLGRGLQYFGSFASIAGLGVSLTSNQPIGWKISDTFAFAASLPKGGFGVTLTYTLFETGITNYWLANSNVQYQLANPYWHTYDMLNNYKL